MKNSNNELARTTSSRYLVVILALALVLRLGVACYLGDKMDIVPGGGSHDQMSYDLLAHRVATGHGFTFPVHWYPWVEPDVPTSYYSGAMVLHLALIYRLFGYHPLIARVLYAILGTAICYLVYLLGKRLFGRSAGLVAAGLASIYTYLVLYSATLLTETPFILCLLASLNLYYDLVEQRSTSKLFLFGASLAGMVLFRMASSVAIVALLLFLYLSTRKRTPRLSWSHLLIPVTLIVLAVAPWTIRNYSLYGRFMLLESQFGHVLWNSNHPDRGDSFGDVGWVAPIPDDLAGLNEADLTYELLRRARANIVNDPGRYLRLTLSRVGVFFMFWPSRDSSLVSNLARVLSFGLMLPFMVYGIVSSYRQYRVLAPIYIFLLAHYGVYLSSWVMIRYRIPADTVLLVFAGFGLVELYWRLSAWRGSRPVVTRSLAHR
jgi:4-amino-4-deoxy-L-arabinose transferase-like glycosyltransferase